MSITLADDAFCSVFFPQCHAQCRASSPVYDEGELQSASLHEDNDFVGLSDDEEEDLYFQSAAAYEPTKLLEVLSDQADMDTDSCNMSLRSTLSSEDSLGSSVGTVSGSMKVEMDSDQEDDEAVDNSRSYITYDTVYDHPKGGMQGSYAHFVNFTPQQPSPLHAQQQAGQAPARPSHIHQQAVNQRPHHRTPPLASKMDNADLASLGLIPKPSKATPPIYPASLPFVRCCYDSNESKGCGKGNKCYHIHRDPAHRCKSNPAPTQGRHHEVQVDRPHFLSFDATNDNDHPLNQSLPCHYGMNCKNPHHRDCAVKHKFNAAAMKEYDAYLRSFRSYEFELITYQLSINKARRELTDDIVLDAFSRYGREAVLSPSTRQQLSALRPW